MGKVLVYGTFDIFHPGHEYFLKEALKHGKELHVVVARDETVKKLKGKLPTNDEKKRKKTLNDLEYVYSAHLGSLGDKYECTKELKPDVIVLGYDQNHFISGLMDLLNKSLPRSKVVRIGAFQEEKFKSSLLKEKD